MVAEEVLEAAEAEASAALAAVASVAAAQAEAGNSIHYKTNKTMQNQYNPKETCMAAPNRVAVGKQSIPNQFRNEGTLSITQKKVLRVLQVL